MHVYVTIIVMEGLGKKMTLSLLKAAINWMINGSQMMQFFICNDRDIKANGKRNLSTKEKL